MWSSQQQHNGVERAYTSESDRFGFYSVKRASHVLCMIMKETEWEMTVKVLASGGSWHVYSSAYPLTSRSAELVSISSSP